MALSKSRQLALFILFFTTAACLLFRPEISAAALQSGLQVCANAVLPSLFPFFLLSELWIRSGLGNAVSELASPIVQHVFHVPKTGASALILGMIGGYPIGAATIASLYQKGFLESADANQLLLFCCNAGPAFLVGVLGGGLFQSPVIGLALWGVHLLAACCIGIVLRKKDVPKNRTTHEKVMKTETGVFTESAVSAIATAVRVCGFVLLFSLLSGHIMAIEILHRIPFFPVLLGSLELAGGSALLASVPWNAGIKFVIAAVLSGWGGLCVHGQTISILQEANLSVKSYLYGKLLHAAVSGLIAMMVVPLLPLSVHCSSFPGDVNIASLQWLLAAAALFFLLLAKFTTGKAARYRL